MYDIKSKITPLLIINPFSKEGEQHDAIGREKNRSALKLLFFILIKYICFLMAYLRDASTAKIFSHPVALSAGVL